MNPARDAAMNLLEVGDEVALITSPTTIQRGVVTAVEPGKPGLATVKLVNGEIKRFGFMALIIKKRSYTS